MFQTNLQVHFLLYKIFLFVINTKLIIAYGMTTMQCPNGYFISKFSSSYDGNERFYKFSCTKFAPNILVTFFLN